MTDILALDIATTTGWARGKVGNKPIAGSVGFRWSENSDSAIFGNCLTWLSDLLNPEPRPDVIIIEQMLPPAAMDGRTSRAVRDRLAGLHGIVRAVAFLRGVYRVEEARVTDVRHHFIGGNQPRRSAKASTIAACKRLGWDAVDDNAADALALWSYACGMLNIHHAINVTPLFGRHARK